MKKVAAVVSVLALLCFGALAALSTLDIKELPGLELTDEGMLQFNGHKYIAIALDSDLYCWKIGGEHDKPVAKLIEPENIFDTKLYTVKGDADIKCLSVKNVFSNYMYFIREDVDFTPPSSQNIQELEVIYDYDEAETNIVTSPEAIEMFLSEYATDKGSGRFISREDDEYEYYSLSCDEVFTVSGVNKNFPFLSVNVTVFYDMEKDKYYIDVYDGSIEMSKELVRLLGIKG